MVGIFMHISSFCSSDYSGHYLSNYSSDYIKFNSVVDQVVIT